MNVMTLERAFKAVSKLLAQLGCLLWPVVLAWCFTMQPTFPFVPGLCSLVSSFCNILVKCVLSIKSKIKALLFQLFL